MDSRTLLDDALLLIEQNFYFLHAGEFFDAISRQTDLSSIYDPRIYKIFDDSTAYIFNPVIIAELMSEAYGTPSKDPTLFEYFVEFNAVRGICMAMVEANRFENDFRSFMQDKLGQQYENFIDMVSFVRNVLSHNIHAEIHLDEKDFKGTRERIIRMHRDPDIHFVFDYATDLPEIGTPMEGYGCKCHINFSAMRTGDPFLDIIPQIKLVKLSELCFNFAIAYRKTK
jgi:hypothetical protein